MLGSLTGEARLEGHAVAFQSEVRLNEGHSGALKVVVRALGERVINAIAESLQRVGEHSVCNGHEKSLTSKDDSGWKVSRVSSGLISRVRSVVCFSDGGANGTASVDDANVTARKTEAMNLRENILDGSWWQRRL